ncbi:MAG: hypothetical protein KME29_13260 [Calothrix sp. FI2-JRJ7]|jgi:hypothetical protein|nr:hypothetical protein [Calothrix sp. FI2-JRJ7]
MRKLVLNCYKVIAATALTTIAVTSQVTASYGITFVTQSSALGDNDQLDWSNLGVPSPFNFLPNSFGATSSNGLKLNVDIATSNVPGVTSPLVFQTLPPPGGIPTNFAAGDFLLFTGFNPRTFPAVGNPGPLSITFEKPVQAVGTQIAVDDTTTFTAFISAFDNDSNLLGTFSAPGTSSLNLDNSALFLGVKSDTANIARLVFSTSENNRAFAINKLRLATVPEPSLTGAIYALSALGMIFAVKRKLKLVC